MVTAHISLCPANSLVHVVRTKHQVVRFGDRRLGHSIALRYRHGTYHPPPHELSLMPF